MKLKAFICNIQSGGPLIISLSKETAHELDLFPGDRVKVSAHGSYVIAVCDISHNLKEDEIGILSEVNKTLKLNNGELVLIEPTETPETLAYIRKKLDNKPLTKDEIFAIVDDIVDNVLTEAEIAYFVASAYTNKFSMEETENLVRAMALSGEILKWKTTKVLDKHCLAGDVPTIIKNKNNIYISNIGDVVNSIIEENSRDVIRDKEAEFTTKGINGLKVLTYDEKGKVCFKKINKVFRVKSPKQLFELKLKGNRRIKATRDHEIFVLKDGKIEEQPLFKVKKGDYVLVPCGFESNQIKPIIIPKSFIKSNKRNKKFPNKINITPEFVRFLGYYIAEGFTNEQGIFLNFGSHEKELIKDAQYCIKKIFNIEPTVGKAHETAVRVRIYGQDLVSIFKRIILAGDTSHYKKIPSFIFNLPADLKLEFIRSLFKCDGYVRRGYEAIYVTVSKELAVGLQYILSSLGLSTSISESKSTMRKFPSGIYKVSKAYYIYTQAREIFGGRKKQNNSFINLLPVSELGNISVEKINPELKRIFKRQKYITKQKLKQIISNIQSKDIKKLITKDLSVLEVKSINKIKSTSNYVYDLTVDKYHRYIVGNAPIFVHNCIGGVPGNRTTPIVVPIIAAAGATIPKTSSRAITSPSGTADTMEVLTNVEIRDSDEVKRIVNQIGGCLLWGGALNMAPADDKIIKIEKPLSLDPTAMLLSSIMAKKYAAGSTHVLIDIPVGEYSKVGNEEKYNELKKSFEELGKRLGMYVKVIKTKAYGPIGNGIGPALEARDVMWVLENDERAPEDLMDKSLMLAGVLLEMADLVDKDKGKKVAEEILFSGKALRKMKQIIEAQGGDPRISSKDIKVGEHSYDFRAERPGTICYFRDHGLSISRLAGAPKDKKAGIYLHKKLGETVKEGEVLFTVYSESKRKLDEAVDYAIDNFPIIIK